MCSLHAPVYIRFPWVFLFRERSLASTIFEAKSPSCAGLGFFCLVIDGESLQNLIQIEKSKNTAFVSVESLLQMSCLHIFKWKINTPLHIKKECFLSIWCRKVMDFLISSSSWRSWLGRSRAHRAALCRGTGRGLWRMQRSAWGESGAHPPGALWLSFLSLRPKCSFLLHAMCHVGDFFSYRLQI